MSFTWVKPKASSGKKVPKAELARSMGIDEEAYDTILSVAKSIVLSRSAEMLDRARWKDINVREKFNACQQLEADISQRTGDTDFAEAKRLECTKVLSVGTIAEHFIFRAYQILRDSMRVTGAKRGETSSQPSPKSVEGSTMP